jgi:hypothetical protein
MSPPNRPSGEGDHAVGRGPGWDCTRDALPVLGTASRSSSTSVAWNGRIAMLAPPRTTKTPTRCSAFIVSRTILGRLYSEKTARS